MPCSAPRRKPLLKRTSKAAAKRAATFTSRAETLLLAHGFQYTETPRHSYNLVALTRFGVLRAHVHDDWIAMRFEEPLRAVPTFSSTMNRYSGKWNHHFFGYQRTVADYDANVGRFFEQLELQLRRLYDPFNE